MNRTYNFISVTKYYNSNPKATHYYVIKDDEGTIYSFKKERITVNIDNKYYYQNEALDLIPDELLIWGIQNEKTFGSIVPLSRYSEEIIRELSKNCDDVEVLYNIIFQDKLTPELVLNYARQSARMFELIPKIALTREACLEYSRYPEAEIENIPSTLITKEMCDNFLTNGKTMTRFQNHEFNQIVYVYGNKDLIAKAIKVDLFNLKKISIDVLDDEIVAQAFATDPVKTLAFIPISFITSEMKTFILNNYPNDLDKIPEKAFNDAFAEEVVRKDATLFRLLPPKFRTRERCLKGVEINPEYLNKVPSKLLTESFIEELKKKNIEVPSSICALVKNSIKRNALKEQILDKTGEEVTEDNKYYEYRNVSLEEVEKYFSSSTFKTLKELKVRSLCDLFNIVEDESLDLYGGAKDNKAKEIIGTAKLLKYKYMNVDPELDVTPSRPAYKLLIDMGVSYASYHPIACDSSMHDNALTVKTLFEIMESTDTSAELMKIKGFGKKAYDEIKDKCKIVSDYYKQNCEKQEEKPDSEKTEQELLEEVRKLRETIREQETLINNLREKQELRKPRVYKIKRIITNKGDNNG